MFSEKEEKQDVFFYMVVKALHYLHYFPPVPLNQESRLLHEGGINPLGFTQARQ
jgi:hypothetical protein